METKTISICEKKPPVSLQHGLLKLVNCSLVLSHVLHTVEPLNKGHFGANTFVPCREVVPISEVK